MTMHLSSRRQALAVLLGVLLLANSAPPQSLSWIVVQVEFPNGKLSAEMPVRDGRGGMIQFRGDGEMFHTFYWQVNVRDWAAGTVLVTIYSPPEEGHEVLDQFGVVAGGPFARAKTTPPFAMAVLRIE